MTMRGKNWVNCSFAEAVTGHCLLEPIFHGYTGKPRDYL
jgi:hypothetical protein